MTRPARRKPRRGLARRVESIVDPRYDHLTGRQVSSLDRPRARDDDPVMPKAKPEAAATSEATEAKAKKPAPPAVLIDPVRVHGIIVATAVEFLDVPYLYGGDTKDGTDCNGLIEIAGRDGEVYPDGPRLSADEIFQTFREINENAVAPGDIACFGGPGAGGDAGRAVCHHVVLVEHVNESFIGANHGKPMLGYGTAEQEPLEKYVARMKAQDEGRGARVCRVGWGYWRSAFLGWRRYPKLQAIGEAWRAANAKP